MQSNTEKLPATIKIKNRGIKNMKIEKFIEATNELNIDFFTGVPDSQLKALCDYLMAEYLRH